MGNEKQASVSGLNPITDLSALAEQMCRIEHKLDLIVYYLAIHDGTFPLTEMGDPAHSDPLTGEPVKYIMDLLKRHVVRQTSSGTGLIPPASVLFNQPATFDNSGNQGNSNGEP